MTYEDLFSDLLAVPGVCGAVMFQPQEMPRLFWPEDAEWPRPNERFLRGAGQMIRRLCQTHNRLEIRYQRGRFIVQSLRADMAVACFTGRELNLPLLKLTLDEFTQLAAADKKDMLPGYVNGESRSPVYGSGMSVGAMLAGTESHNSSSAMVQNGFVEPLANHAAVAAGLSDISLIATGYLGRSLVNSCWEQTQPAELADYFQLSADGVIEATNDLKPTTEENIRLASEWAQAFVAECQLVRIDLPLQLVAPLNADAQALLSGSHAFGDRGLILLQHSYLRQMLVSHTPTRNNVDDSVTGEMSEALVEGESEI